MTARTVCHCTRREMVDGDLIAACRRLGEIALAAECRLRPRDVAEIASIAEGLQRVLIERQASAEVSV